MLDVQKSLKILKDHFATVTPEEFAANLEEFCPELIEEELAYLNSNGVSDSNFHRSTDGSQATIEVDAITDFISHFFPDLLRFNGKLLFRPSESAEEMFGTIAFRKSQAIWEQLWPRIEAKEAALEAVMDVANNPNSEDFQTVLRVQFRKLLGQDDDLLKSIYQIWLEDSIDVFPAVKVL
jgi:hypothetical protein